MAKKIAFLWLAMIGLLGCSNPLHKTRFVISGTYLEVISPSREASRIVYAEFKRLDKIFNLYDQNSELSLLNRSLGKPQRVSAELLEVLKLSQEIYNLSAGAFDISQGTLYQFWKKMINEGKIKELPQQEAIDKLKELGGMNNLELDFKKQTVTIKKPGLIIDLGGIAIGYMVDKAVMQLKKKGIDSALINAGGDIYCLGQNYGQPWRVGIEDPEELRDLLDTQYLIDEAITTSGDYRQFFSYQGERYSHIIDPKTGYPVQNGLVSVSVITKNCTSADSLATAFLVMGQEGINRFLSQNPSTMRIFVVTQDDQGRHIHFFQ